MLWSSSIRLLTLLQDSSSVPHVHNSAQNSVLLCICILVLCTLFFMYSLISPVVISPQVLDLWLSLQESSPSFLSPSILWWWWYIRISNSGIIQWATLVMHHLFRAHIFWQKCWNQTFSKLIYLLSDDIEKISKSLMRIILQRQRQFWQKCTCNLNVYIFYLRFALGIINGDHCDRKTPKTIVLFK